MSIGVLKNSKWLVPLIVGLVILSSFILRVYNIDIRPFHHDEGVNFHFLRETVKKGYYSYSHENYHGPLYFYVTAFFRGLYGNSELAIRLSSVVAGVALVALPFLVMESAGSVFVVLSAILTALSASLVFHSRYAIHEMLFVTLSVWFAVSVFNWVRIGSRNLLIQSGLALALLIATKETFVITGAAVLLGLLFSFSPREIIRRFWNSKRDFGLAIVISTIVLFGIFSGGFRWVDGIREMFLAVPQWIGRGSGDTGHFKPFLYYTRLLLQTEPWLIFGFGLSVLVLILSILPVNFIKPLIRNFKEDSWFRFLCGCSLGLWLVYGYVKYKTAWLIISQSAFFILLVARLFTILLESKRVVRLVGLCFSALVICGSIFSTYYFNYRFPYGSEHPYCYVHTSEGMLRLVDDIKHYRDNIPTAKVLIGVNTYWPLPYYVRDFEKYVAYQKDPKPEALSSTYDIMILDNKETWTAPGWVRKYYRLSGVQESYTYFRTK